MVERIDLAFEKNHFGPYLHDYPDSGPHADWKKKNDMQYRPRLLAQIYYAIESYLPRSQNSIEMLSIGSNLPTHERLLFDMARYRSRYYPAHMLAIDADTTFSHNEMQPYLNALTMNEPPHLFEFQNIALQDLPTDHTYDVIFAFKSVVQAATILLEPRQRHTELHTERRQNLENHLKKIHSLLKTRGFCIVDMQDRGELEDHTIVDTSGKILVDISNLIPWQKMFTWEIIGTGGSRVMALWPK